eukprot:356656-Chlamydomonas_euryale.AAC.4
MDAGMCMQAGRQAGKQVGRQAGKRAGMEHMHAARTHLCKPPRRKGTHTCRCMAAANAGHQLDYPPPPPPSSPRLVKFCTQLMRTLDFVVVAARHKQRLALVEVHTAHRPVMLIKAVDQRTHPVVPELCICM